MATAVLHPQTEPSSHRAAPARRRRLAIEQQRPASEKGSLQIRAHKERPYYEARWRDLDQVDRRKRLGPAWARPNGEGGWVGRRGSAPAGLLDARRAYPLMTRAIEEHEENLLLDEPTDSLEHALFDAAAADFLIYLETEKRAKPSTLRNTRSLLAKPNGNPKQRGARIMRFFAGRELFGILTKDIRLFLAQLDREDIAPRTVNIHRQVLHAIFEFARRDEAFGLPDNPVSATAKRPEDGTKPIEVFEPDEIRAIANAAQAACHRRRGGYANSIFSESTEQEWERLNAQDACLFVIAVTTGLRMGELLALRWRDVDLRYGLLNVSRSMSDGKETTTTSRKSRVVPLAQQALDAFRELGGRRIFTARTDYVFCSADGGALDRSAVRKRFVRAQEAAGVAVRRFHDLRHTFGTLAVRRFDVLAVKEMMGHAKLTTTERYLHSKPRPNDGEQLTAVFGGVGEDESVIAIGA